MWSIIFVLLHEAVVDAIAKRRKRELEPPKDGTKSEMVDGGVLAAPAPKALTSEQEAAITNDAFQELWRENRSWMKYALRDALEFAQATQPRDSDTIDKVLHPETYKSKEETGSAMASGFAQTWQSLKNRGWKATLLTDGDKAGKTKYEYENKQVRSTRLAWNLTDSRLAKTLSSRVILSVLVARGCYPSCCQASPGPRASM